MEYLRYLNVAAHPDDLDFGVAGTTTTLTAEGHEVVYCIVTDGRSGGSDQTMSRDEMGEIRQAEQKAAAKVVGVSEIHFLDFLDGAVEPNLELRKAITRIIRLVRPDRVITQSPIRNLASMYGSHPDHLATGEATLNAVYPDARNPFAFPELLADEGLAAHTVSQTWLMSGPEADRFIDISAVIETKIEALLCHQSQISDPEAITKVLTEWGERNAAAAGWEPPRLAEAFRVLETG